MADKATAHAKPADAADAEPGLRGMLNRHPVLSAATLLAALAAIVYFVIGPALSNAKIESPSYYTADDGKTLFVDERDRVPPFSAKGGEAVRAVVYRNPDGGEPFALYLVKYKPEAAKAAAVADANDFKRSADGMLYKRPGAGDWLDGDDPSKLKAIAEIKKSTLPNGKHLILVNPT